MGDEACRVDVWLWRARLRGTRALAARLAESGRIRLTRSGRETRVEKASRDLKPGDELVFAVDGRVMAIRVLALGARRGPPAEARGLYTLLDSQADGPETQAASGVAGARDDMAGPDPPSRH